MVFRTFFRYSGVDDLYSTRVGCDFGVGVVRRYLLREDGGVVRFICSVRSERAYLMRIQALVEFGRLRYFGDLYVIRV